MKGKRVIVGGSFPPCSKTNLRRLDSGEAVGEQGGGCMIFSYIHPPTYSYIASCTTKFHNSEHREVEWGSFVGTYLLVRKSSGGFVILTWFGGGWKTQGVWE